MAKLMLALCVLGMWAVMVHVGAAPSSAPAPAPDCLSVLVEMADCLTYVQNGSTVSKPEGGCCSGFKSVLKKTPICLCEAFKNNNNLGIALNMTRAMMLPAACGVSTPPLSNCGAAGVPSAAPGPGPKPSPKNTLSPSASVPSGSVTPTTPGSNSESGAPSPSQSAAAAILTSIATILVCFALATCSYY
ncbi:non-specific lipid transfer protein GPI-anchored 11-like [Magnolia sinica]|uniref:non-specific lipid transfer protein GPI-anchored 11-like n=1 Tax=Magnolia sinica TaxID=86752 RepID=UPI002659E499|nr:non-specific lipid transfer protein GPI-anchored 11-like [Magnolia sinica]